MRRPGPQEGDPHASAEPTRARLTLLGGFALEAPDGRLDIPHAAQRPIAMLALQSRPLQRVYVAGQLWPDVGEERAAGNLRSALWRLRRAGFSGIERHHESIALAPWVSVDARDFIDRATAFTSGANAESVDVNDAASASEFVGELLPDWYDDWVLIERERIRQLGLHALEAMARAYTRAGRFAEAIDAALIAIRSEPYRESAHRALIRAHLAEGNQHDALRQYRFFREMIERDLGVEPSFRYEELCAQSPVAPTLR